MKAIPRTNLATLAAAIGINAGLIDAPYIPSVFAMRGTARFPVRMQDRSKYMPNECTYMPKADRPSKRSA